MPKLKIVRLILLFAAAWTFAQPSAVVRAQTNLKYQQPPKAIIELVDVQPTPTIRLSPEAKRRARWMLIEQFSGLPSVADLAQPEFRLAGRRFNPRTNGPSRGRYITSLKIQELPNGKEIAIAGLPASPKIYWAEWSPDARKIFFVNASDSKDEAGLSLWIVDVATAQAHRLPDVALNGTFGDPCEWVSDSQRLVCKTVSTDRGPAPTRNEIPTGPIVQENLGRLTPGRTYEDLLKNPEDEVIFDYYAASQLVLVAVDGGNKTIGKPGIFTDASPSPDGNYVLASERHRPYSYLLPFETFPERVSVIDLKNNANSKQLADKPLEDNVPSVNDAVPIGPRDYDWRSDAPATVAWVEAGDGGDPRKEAAVRDTIFLLDAPFDATPRKLVDLPVRYERVAWANDRLALVEGRCWKDRKRIILAVAPSAPAAAVKLYEGSFEDRYHDPGEPLEEINSAGKPVLQTTSDGNGIYFRSPGASSEGDKPFLSVTNAANGERNQLWQSAAPFYEIPFAVLDTSTQTILIRRESQEKNPNFYLEKIGGSPEQITFFPSPYGNAELPKKQVLHYKRSDGVDLSANLYLPVGYKPQDGPLPALMEAYPTEYKTKAAAGQVTGSPYQFPILYWGSPIPFVTQGYAVLENATIPIVGEGKAEPNDTYVEQLVASAKAAIDEGVRLGVVDRNRVAVMGHSYGAFMTANLLAHSDLFKAGIARSGAYNRTLTPFGFQNEDRTYWEAPETYYKMSPFSFADKIKTPLLMIHGEADDNSGTFPVQSERFFSALKGHGATVRFVLLPLEAHGYAGRESILHMFWEMNNWLNTYVKNPGSTAATAQR